MDLDLDLTVGPMIGRKRCVLDVAEVGELCAADLAALGGERGIKALPLKRLSDRHHRLAQSLAGGMGPSEAAYACGYQPSRVSILIADEAFKDLLEHYRTVPEAAYADLHQRLAGMSIDAADEISRRMDEDREREEGDSPQLSTGQLMNILTIGADRTGYGPATKATHVHLHAGLAQRLEMARKRVAELRDITPPDEASGPGQANGVIEAGHKEKKDERT